MIRKNGFIVLENFKEISRLKEGNHAFNKISWQDEEWIYKWYKNKNTCINEVFWSYVLKYLPVASVEYDMAKQGKMIGVISKNYNPEDYYTFSIDELIEFYQKKTKIDDIDYSYENIIKVYKCAFGEYDEAYLTQLKKETLDKFMIQILLGNEDLHRTNMGILLNPNPEMTPLYDYMRYGRVILSNFALDHFRLEYSGSNSTPKKTFLKFLEMAPKEELETLRMLMTAIEELNFKQLFEEMESNIEKKILTDQKKTLEYIATRNTYVAEKMMRKRAISI